MAFVPLIDAAAIGINKIRESRSKLGNDMSKRAVFLFSY
jgi:hypothetical protein